MPGPIEDFLADRLRVELAGAGVGDASIDTLSAEAEDWRFRVRSAGRVFEAGFNHREQLWCREVTAGQERPLVSNDEPGIGTSSAARQSAVRRIRAALRQPGPLFRDPPVL